MTVVDTSEAGSSNARHGRRTYRRVLLKVSGEVLMGETPYGIDMKTVDAVAADIAAIAARDSIGLH